MKLYLLILSIVILILASCKKENGKEDVKSKLPAEFTVDIQNLDFVPTPSQNPNSGGFAFYDDKGGYYSLYYRRVNPEYANATVLFSTDDLINPSTSKPAPPLIQETVAFSHNNPMTVTVAFNDLATVEQTLGAKNVTLVSKDTTVAHLYVGFKWIEDEYWADINKAAAAYKNVIALTNDIQPSVPGIQPTSFEVTIEKLN